MSLFVLCSLLIVKVKEGHTPMERRRGAHLPYIGRWARRWANHYCLWRMASCTPDLRLPSQPKLLLIAHTQRDGQVELTWVAGYIPRYTRPKTTTHPGTTRAQRRVTTLVS